MFQETAKSLLIDIRYETSSLYDDSQKNEREEERLLVEHTFRDTRDTTLVKIDGKQYVSGSFRICCDFGKLSPCTVRPARRGVCVLTGVRRSSPAGFAGRWWWWRSSYYFTSSYFASYLSLLFPRCMRSPMIDTGDAAK